MMQEKEKLPGDYIAGFVDGEGCFYLTYRSETRYERKGAPKYFRWTPYFAITLRGDDLSILQKIQSTLGCGKIYQVHRGQVSFNVQNIADLYEKIMPFFNRHPLRAKKRQDFTLWCQALNTVYGNKKCKRSCSAEDDQQLSLLRQSMKQLKAIGMKEYRHQPVLPA